MTKYEDDIEELRLQFVKVDVNNIESIQKWFAQHPYLSTADHARVSGRSNHWIRKLKRKAYIKGRTPKKLPKSTKRKAIDPITPPENWDDPIWLAKVAKTNSVMAISRVTNVSRRTILRRFAKYNIKSLGEKAVMPKNPCFTHAWCYEHYITRGWPQHRCAKAAGICQQTFSNWLVKLKIPVKSPIETMRGSLTKIWVRKMIHNLENTEIVRKVHLRSNHVHVRFMNYFWESYFIDRSKEARKIPHSFPITKSDAKLTSVPATYTEYESDIRTQEDYPAHISIRKQDWKKASFLERRLALQEFTRIINRRGWIQPKYPRHIIEADFERIQKSVHSKFIKKCVFTAYPQYGNKEYPGLRIIEHFFDLSELWWVFKSPKRTMKVLNRLMDSNSQINLHNTIRTACFTSLIKPNIKLYDPGVFIWLFKRLNITGTVLDLYPNNGHHAMACAVAGLKYMTIPTEKFTSGIDNGFAEFIGLDYEPYDGRKVDLVLSNNDFRTTDVNIAMEYANKTKNMIHFVKREKKHTEQLELKPSKIIPIITQIYCDTPDYLFLF